MDFDLTSSGVAWAASMTNRFRACKELHYKRTSEHADGHPHISRQGTSLELHIRVDGEMIRFLQFLPFHALASAPTLQDFERVALAHNVVNCLPPLVIGVCLCPCQVGDGECGFLAYLPFHEILHDSCVHVSIHVPHPDDGRIVVLLLHLLKLPVHLHELALVQPIASALAVTDVGPTKHNLSARRLFLQNCPIGGAGTPSGALAICLSHTALDRVPFVAVVEEVRSVSLRSSPSWLRPERSPGGFVQGMHHAFNGRSELTQANYVGSGLRNDAGQPSQLIVLPVHIPLKNLGRGGTADTR